jgi:hypothetical protein
MFSVSKQKNEHDPFGEKTKENRKMQRIIEILTDPIKGKYGRKKKIQGQD